MTEGFQRVAILGTGLIGGSFGLAVRRALPDARVVGWDRAGVLQAAVARGAIAVGVTDLQNAVADADLVYVALPVGATLEVLPQVARHAAQGALATDACSIKANIVRAASEHFRSNGACFVGGHPLAGKETAGVEHAEAELFRGARYALIGSNANTDERVARFAALLKSIGAAPVWMEAEAHDRAVAFVSHLPQLAAVALAGVLRDATDHSGLPLMLAGPGARDTLRLAGSPYALWRDICLANRDNIAAAMDQMMQALDHLRARLTSRELQEEFDAANEIYKILRQTH
ncbi:MAG: prephenate dehydrogenase [Candidatus Acidiferrales bacterium]